MALGFISLDSAEETTTDGVMTTASVSPGSGSVLYITIVITNASGWSSVTQDFSAVGLSGTWTQLEKVVYGGRRSLAVLRGTKATAWGSGTIVITWDGPSSPPAQDMAFVLDEVTGADSTTPNDAAVIGAGSDNVTLPDVGTVDSGDAVYVAGAIESSAQSFAATGYTGISTLTGLTNVREIKTWQDDTSPDETPNLTSSGSGNGVGGIAFIINVAAAGGGRIMSSLAYSGGLVSSGGIAGVGGGLAN